MEGEHEERFARQQALFGREGQLAIRAATAAVAGSGGLGTHVAQQLALLGVGALIPIDDEDLSLSNRNRYVGARWDDPIPGSRKVELVERMINDIDPSIRVEPISGMFPSAEAVAAILKADVVFGCFDHDGPRFVLNELCLAFNKVLIDLASDVPEPGYYGGRVTVVGRGKGCLQCRYVLDARDVRRYLSPNEALENEDAVYGVNRRLLGESGPSVVSVNGVVASLGVTEFMVMVTGLREPVAHLEYRAHLGTVSKRTDDPSADCYYCQSVKGSGAAANIERYFPLAEQRKRERRDAKKRCT